MQVHANLFAVFGGSFAKTWIDQGRMVNHQTYQPVQAGRRAWV
jgi:hypothetical protein